MASIGQPSLEIRSAAVNPLAAASSRRASDPGVSTPDAASLLAAARSASRKVSTSAAIRGSNISVAFHRGELARLMFGDECIDQFVELRPFQHRLQLVQRQIDAMVRHPPLREIVGANALRAV